MLPGLEMLIQQCASQVHPVTMKAVVMQESGGNPYAIHINGNKLALSRRPSNAAEAADVARRLDQMGANFDLGLVQLNSANVKRFGLSWTQAVDPCTNLQYGSALLVANFKRAGGQQPTDQAAISKALSMFNTGNSYAGFSNGYVSSVRGQAVRIEKRNK